ncbi:ADP-glyceromanno-heptose 6-epimerase [bacterium]|jgi:ADP-L-glycero-D-manno-heptose 6-epimerase|nr:ADP-glyceromanno-heptose 6-epimerase [bacterium]
MIVITGGAGFIGSAFAWKCNIEGRSDLIIVDNIQQNEKWRNLVSIQYHDYLHKSDFIEQILTGTFPHKVDAIVHMGACSATTEMDMDYLMENNYRYTKILAEWCLKNDARFIYASSAATYGNGEFGFEDDESKAKQLKPINRYGYSKQLFDLHALNQGWLDNIVGLKFFNVFGPNEFHKEGMKSVMCKAYPEVLKTKRMNLFKSYRKNYTDGGQQRDFVYVKDVVNVIWWLLNNRAVSGLFNVGTGTCRSWNELAFALFKSMDIPPAIDYIDMPDNLINQYQYYTQASMNKLKGQGCDVDFMTLEEAMDDYVSGYLKDGNFLSSV